MRFLLDENIPEDFIVALQEEGHDVVWVSDTRWRGAKDEAIWREAARSQRILVTADLDFPLPGVKPPGLMILRGFDRVSTGVLAQLLTEAIQALGNEIVGRLVVISPGRVRKRSL